MSPESVPQTAAAQASPVLPPPLAVALAACSGYGGPPGSSGSSGPSGPPGPPGPSERFDDLVLVVDAVFRLAGYAPGRGEQVLVKPNLLRADALTCTEPAVVRAVCAWLLDRGVRVRVSDSPGFGTAPGVAAAIGLQAALDSLKDAFGNSVRLEVCGPGPACVRQIPGLGPLRISRLALEADSLLSVPRLKAHTQMGLTCAVKNLFGCVPGVHKALAHARHGDKGQGGDNLPRLIAALARELPPQAALVDAVLTMHRNGPSHGEPYALGLVAASASCVAADTALYSLLGLTPSGCPSGGPCAKPTCPVRGKRRSPCAARRRRLFRLPVSACQGGSPPIPSIPEGWL